jgi:hypothetical protein
MPSTPEERDPDMLEGVELGPDDPLPDVPEAGDDSVPITSPNPIDFSTDGLTYAGSVGMSTFNDGTDETLFERTVDAYEDADADSPMLDPTDSPIRGNTIVDSGDPDRRRARIY